MRALPLVALSAAFALAGCAFGPGSPFATVDGVVVAEYAVSADRVADGWAKLASDYQIQLTGARIGIVDVELRARSGGGGGGGGGTFDPANPPPGYSLCHGGHCHREDGALIPYEEIQAELAGGAPTVTTLATFRVGAELDAIAADERSLTCDGSCELGLTTITEVRSDVNLVALQGLVRDSRATPRLAGEVSFVLSAASAVLRTATEIPADRSHPPHIDLRVRAEPKPDLFDALDWAALARSGDVIDFSLAENADALDEVVDTFSASALTVDVERTE
jgi:hypothetical protein